MSVDPTGPTGVAAAITRAHRDEWARVVAGLARRFGSLDIAEDAAAEAFATAVARWPDDGVPPNPGAWLTVTARRHAIDRIRREAKRDDKQREAMDMLDDESTDGVPGAALVADGEIEDDRLRLLATCCHPALALDSRVALTLRMVGGLTVGEIARAFFVQEGAMARRITRAKAKIAEARIPYRVPDAEALPERVRGMLAVLLLVFNEGYLATGSTDDAAAPTRDDLADEAIRLTRMLHELLPRDGEVAGLLALMLLTQARRPARFAAGELVPLDEQDRDHWDPALIVEGHALVRARLASGEAPGPYQLLAAVNAVHTDAATSAATDWAQIVALYDQLVILDPSPVVALNRAVAVGELDGPQVALALVDALPGLDDYDALHAVRADLLRRLGRMSDARAAYDRAIALATNPAERATLRRRRDAMSA